MIDVTLSPQEVQLLADQFDVMASVGRQNLDPRVPDADRLGPMLEPYRDTGWTGQVSDHDRSLMVEATSDAVEMFELMNEAEMVSRAQALGERLRNLQLAPQPLRRQADTVNASLFRTRFFA